MKTYETLTEAVNDLLNHGYKLNFNIRQDCIQCAENKVELRPDEFEIDEWHRFQEMSDVDDEAILYAISSLKDNMKGLLVNAYGIYSDSGSAKLVAKLSTRPK